MTPFFTDRKVLIIGFGRETRGKKLEARNRSQKQDDVGFVSCV